MKRIDFLTMALIILLSVISISAGKPTPIDSFLKSGYETQVIPLEETVNANESNNELVDRLVDGIWKWKTLNGTVPWWFCGIGIKEQESIDKAHEWVDTTLKEIEEIKKTRGYNLNIWGIFGVMSRESAFDECAIGLHTRSWAYKNGLLKRNKRHITHTRDEIFSVVNNKEWKKTWKWVDAGPGQLLWGRIYKGPLEDMLSVKPGIRITVVEMVDRYLNSIQSVNFKSKMGLGFSKRVWWYNRPWALWPGSISKEYTKKVERRARLLGATKEELPISI